MNHDVVPGSAFSAAIAFGCDPAALAAPAPPNAATASRTTALARTPLVFD